MTARNRHSELATEHFDVLLERVAEDTGLRHGGVVGELPEDHLLARPKTLDDEPHRGKRLYRAGRVIGSVVHHWLQPEAERVL